jgi:hypothetical protein
VYSLSDAASRVSIDLRCSVPVEGRRLCRELEPWFAEAGSMVDAARDKSGWFVRAHRA